MMDYWRRAWATAVAAHLRRVDPWYGFRRSWWTTFFSPHLTFVAGPTLQWFIRHWTTAVAGIRTSWHCISVSMTFSGSVLNSEVICGQDLKPASNTIFRFLQTEEPPQGLMVGPSGPLGRPWLLVLLGRSLGVEKQPHTRHPKGIPGPSSSAWWGATSIWRSPSQNVCSNSPVQAGLAHQSKSWVGANQQSPGHYRVWQDTLLRQDASKEPHTPLQQMAFVRLQLQVGLLDTLQDLTQSAQVFINISPEYDDVIQIDETGGPLQAIEGQLHDTLKRCWGVTEPKWHSGVLKESVSCDEGGLWYIFLLPQDLVVCRGDVQCGEITRTGDSIQAFLHAGQGKGIFDCNSIDPSVVHTWTHWAILLPHQHNWGSPWRSGGSHRPLGHHLVDSFLVFSCECHGNPSRGLFYGRGVSHIHSMSP